MKRHTFLQTATLAVPGTLLSGWAPARGTVRQIHLVVRETGGDRAPGTLSQGVDLGLEEVAWSARLLHVPLVVTRVSALAECLDVDDPAAVQIVVAARDDYEPDQDGAWGTRIHTCPLLSWRPDAWSVASPLAAEVGDIRLDWHPDLATPGAGSLNARFRRRTGMPMDAAAWHGWMAVKVAFEIALRAGEDDLLALQFDGHKGSPLHFSEDGHLVQPTVRVRAGRPELVEAIDLDLVSDFH
jgi:hypothetical protein